MFDIFSEEQLRNMSITPPFEDLAPTMANCPLVLILSNTKSGLFRTLSTACTMAGCRRKPEGVVKCRSKPF
ncbi:hypothetical protein KIN20_037513 [Parelaphostrongylus tenuis]|uniref:Uncharacterized protein n=1 Tax=Parelaphostrongylus tenuis TaxID=148309 RepID=A0AAD5WLD0_PARTN|nr:hypothetical protein KIN20_037513 [Parelaphostrongylus tenuis]